MDRNKSIIKNIMIRDLGLCCCCGFKANEIHHIIPLINGGEDTPKNMIAICSDCHRFSPDTKEEFIEYINMGGHKIPYLLGKSLLYGVNSGLTIEFIYPKIKEIIRYLRELDINNCIELYGKKSLKLNIEEADLKIEKEMILKCL